MKEVLLEIEGAMLLHFPLTTEQNYDGISSSSTSYSEDSSKSSA